jgi:enamine deaminase RidA (YjgF/YER057c/UK114 family)
MSRLHYYHLPAGRQLPHATSAVLGGTRLSLEIPAVDWPEQVVFSPLPPTPDLLWRECWCADDPCTAGRDDGIDWRRAGDVLFGVITLNEADFIGDAAFPLQAASESAYRRLFRLLEAQQLPELWRVWNYFADINGETGGLERYRQFNIGRQDAFLACRHATTGNVPAACAIGLHGEPQNVPLSIAFMAGRTPTIAIENPRQISAYHYPDRYGPRSPTFSRAVLAYPRQQEALFISGTASIVGHQTVHVGDVTGQCRETLANIAAVLEQANQKRRSAPFTLEELSYRIYLRHPRDHEELLAALKPRLGDARFAIVAADICRSDLLLEIEAHALHALAHD